MKLALALVVMLLGLPGVADDIFLIRFEKKPLWMSNPAAVEVMAGEPSYITLVGQCEISEQLDIPEFQSLLLDVRMLAGKKGHIYLKLIEKSGAEYITPTVDINGTSDWQELEFKRKEMSIAPWSDDDNYHLDFPLVQIYFVYTTSENTALDMRTLRARSGSEKLPTAEYPLVSAWIARLASKSKPKILSLPTPNSKPTLQEYKSSVGLKSRVCEFRFDKASGQLLQATWADARVVWIPDDGVWWSVVTFDGDIFSNADATSFKYAWDDGVLRLAYMFRDKLEVVLVLSADGNSLKVKALVKNRGVSPISHFRLPDRLTLDISHIQRVVLPRLGGVELLPGYFKSSRRLGMDYPSDAMSDFLWVDAGGPLSVFCIQDEPMFWSSRLKLKSVPNEGWFEYSRDTKTFIGAGSAWISPSIVFLWNADPIGAFKEYWHANGLDKAPVLESKLPKDLFERLKSSILLKYDFDYVAPQTKDRQHVFSEFAGRLAALPSPILLHLVCYWNPPEINRRADGGVFDTNYPEFLPPRQEYGGTQGFSQYLRNAASLGMLVMPYTNPTCWSKESISYSTLGNDVGAKDAEGSLLTGWGMVTITPNHPQVLAKNRKLRMGFMGDTKVDILFEDQVGARSHTFDFNPNATHPASYTHDLIEHARQASADIPLMTERGFDMLVPYESGFCGIELGLACTTFMKGWEWNNYYGEGNWRVFPLDTWFINPHAALYHHDLGQFVLTKGDISWCLAKGYNMTYAFGHSIDWLLICDAFQKMVCSRFFGQRLKSFEYLNDTVTKTVFPAVTIVANHSAETEFRYYSCSLAKEGFLALDEEGHLIAGILTRMYGLDLGRDCFVTQQIEQNRVHFRLVSSSDGPVAAIRLKDWTDPTAVKVVAVTSAGELPVQAEVLEDSIRFKYLSTIADEPVKEYLLHSEL